MDVNYLSKIKECVANANLGSALEKLERSYTDYSNEITTLKYRLSEVETSEIKGTWSNEAISLEKNKITDGVLKLIDKLGKNDREMMGIIWKERQTQNDYIFKNIQTHNPKRLVVHDSFFSRNKGHKWERGIDYSLEQGNEVILILSDPKSEAYKKRKLTLGIKNPIEEIPESIYQKQLAYPDTFQLYLIDDLYNGPFVLIEDFKLFLGLFLPEVHSEDLPIFEFWRTSSKNNVFRSLEHWIEEITNGK